ncbi:MAG TPA: UDP-N-acetylglucosamine 2-epimerase (non-hydrolyzing) [Candidatus Baltobacteraceae bacterium]|nr:UDP-N-acetylglucosamine 2-epimerase (non-hydrolyzing) [Candidatus Baltobacteraceae bacterium]
MRVLSVVGARPQFVKAALLSAEMARRGVHEIVVHTGQHYDRDMSEVFFEELALPAPSHHLGVGSGGHGEQTGEMLKRLEPVVQQEQPDWLLIYGDTNSTLAGALVGAKLHVPVAHVEAGLRSFNRAMPEEINRVVADHVSRLLLVPSRHAADQLEREGITHGVHVVGDLMVDLALQIAARLPAQPPILERLGVRSGGYYTATIHRASNTDDPQTFARLIEGLRGLDMPVVFPVHPRTRAIAAQAGAGVNDNIVLCSPLAYAEMLGLLRHSAALFTDSGGLQKEAFVLKIPCVTLREETEWLDTLEDGWNVLAGSDPRKIVQAARRILPVRQSTPFGDGTAARRIVDALAYGLTASAISVDGPSESAAVSASSMG